MAARGIKVADVYAELALEGVETAVKSAEQKLARLAARVQRITLDRAAFTEFQNNLKARLESLSVNITRIGTNNVALSELKNKIKTSLDRTLFGLRLGVSISQIQGIARRIREQLALTNIGLTLTVGERELAKIRAVLKSIRPEINAKIDIDEAAIRAKLATIRSFSIKGRVDIDRGELNRATGGAKALDREIGSLSGNFNILPTRLLSSRAALIAFAVAAALAAGVVSGFGANLLDLVNIVAVAPAGIAFLGASFAAIKLGIGGIGDAFSALKDQAKAGSKATSSIGEDMQQLADRVDDARYALAQLAKRGPQDLAAMSRDVKKAIQDQTTATKGIADAFQAASRKIEDYRLALSAMKGDTLSAAAATAKAKLDFENAQFDPTISPEQRLQLKADYEQAIQRQKELTNSQKNTREDASKAIKAGPNGDQGVIDAKQKLADATQNVTDRQQELTRATEDYNRNTLLAQRALRDALSAQAIGVTSVATAANKVNDAFKKLSPNARKFVEEVERLKPAWKGVQQAIQDALFSGFDTTLDKLSRAQLPGVRDGLVKVADGFNEVGKKAAGFLSSKDGVSILRDILDKLGETVGKLAPAVKPFLDGLFRLTDVGSKTFPGLASDIGKAADHFDRFIKAGQANGSIADYIEKAYKAFGSLGRIIANVASILNSLFRGYDTKNGGFLDGVEKSTKKFRDFLQLKDTKNRIAEQVTHIRNGINDVKDVLSSAKTGVKQFFDGFGGGEAGKQLDNLKKKAGGFDFKQIFNGVNFREIGSTISDVFGRILEIVKPFLPLLKQVGAFLGPLAKLLASFLGPLIKGVSEGLAPIFKALGPIFDILGPVVGALGKAFGDMIKPIGQLIGFVLRLITPLIKFLAPVLKFLAPIIAAVALPFGDLGLVLGKLGPIVEFLLGPLGKFAGPVMKGLQLAVEGAGKVFDFLATLLGKVFEPLLVRLGSKLFPIIAKVFEFVRALTGITQFGALFRGFSSFFVKALGGIGVAFEKIAGFLGDGLLRGLGNLPKTVIKFFLKFFNDVVGFVKKIFGINSPSTVFAEIGHFLLEGLLAGIKLAATLVFDYFVKLPLFILGKLGDLGSLLLDAGGKLLAGLLKGIEAYVHFVWDFWTQFVPNVVKKLGSVAKSLFKKGVELLSGLFDGIKNVAVTLFKWYIDLPGVILKKLGDVAKTLFKKGRDLLSGLFDGVKDIAVGFFKWYVSLPGVIIGKLGNVARTLYTKGRDLLSGLFTGVKEIGSSIFSWFTSLPGRFVSGIGNLARTLYQKGKDLIQGLLDGAGSLLTKIGSFFLDKLPGFIKTPFKKALGINSPSTVFAEYAKNTLEGFSVGSDAHLDKVTAAMQRASKAALKGFDSPELKAQISLSGQQSAGAVGSSYQAALASIVPLPQAQAGPNGIPATPAAAAGPNITFSGDVVINGVTSVDRSILPELKDSFSDALLTVALTGQIRNR